MVSYFIYKLSWGYILRHQQRNNSADKGSFFISEENKAIYKSIIHFLRDFTFDILRKFMEYFKFNEPCYFSLR